MVSNYEAGEFLNSQYTYPDDSDENHSVCSYSSDYCGFFSFSGDHTYGKSLMRFPKFLVKLFWYPISKFTFTKFTFTVQIHASRHFRIW